MNNLKRLILVLCLLLVAAAALIFVLENQQPASLVFLGFALPVLPLSVFVLLALVVGLIVGPLLAFVGSVLKKRS